jgi:hypothetical protein
MIASSRRAQIKERLDELTRIGTRTPLSLAYVDDVELLFYELERVERLLFDAERDRDAYRASYKAERALRTREREQGRGWFGRWLGL